MLRMSELEHQYKQLLNTLDNPDGPYLDSTSDDSIDRDQQIMHNLVIQHGVVLVGRMAIHKAAIPLRSSQQLTCWHADQDAVRACTTTASSPKIQACHATNE